MKCDFQEPILSVCIVTRNASSTLQRLLSSFNLHFRNLPFSHEYVFVDNASVDSTLDLIQKFILKNPQSILIKRSTNSLGLARQQALEAARGEYVYFVDGDCEVLHHTLQTLFQSILFLDNSWAGVGGVQHFVGPFGQTLNSFRKSYLGHLGSTQLRIPKVGQNVSHISTCSALYRKNALNIAGGFNMALNTAAEDLDLSLRLKSKGYHLFLEPSSVVLHHHANNFRDWFKKAYRNGVWQSLLARYNILHLLSYRFWLLPCALLILFLILFISPIALVFCICAYLSIVCAESLRVASLVKAPVMIYLFVASHLVYFTSGLIGLMILIKRFSWPIKAPSSTARA